MAAVVCGVTGRPEVAEPAGQRDRRAGACLLGPGEQDRWLCQVLEVLWGGRRWVFASSSQDPVTLACLSTTKAAFRTGRCRKLVGQLERKQCQRQIVKQNHVDQP
jgi:hypothetical protein